MRRQFGFALAFVVGFVACHLACGTARRPGPTAAERSVHIDRPDPTAKTGRRTDRLTVWRVTGGPEGTHEYRPVPEVVAPDGTRDFAIVGTDLWTLTIGPRTYVLGPRD